MDSKNEAPTNELTEVAKSNLEGLAKSLILAHTKQGEDFVQIDMSQLWGKDTFTAITDNQVWMTYVNDMLEKEGLIVGTNAFGGQTLLVCTLDFMREHSTNSMQMSEEDFSTLVENCGDEQTAREVLLQMCLNKERH